MLNVGVKFSTIVGLLLLSLKSICLEITDHVLCVLQTAFCLVGAARLCWWLLDGSSSQKCIACNITQVCAVITQSRNIIYKMCTYWREHSVIGHDRRRWFKTVGEAVRAIRVVEARLRINAASVVYREVHWRVRTNIRNQLVGLLSRFRPIECWIRRFIPRVAVFLKDTVAQSGPFPYENFAYQLEIPIVIDWSTT